MRTCLHCTHEGPEDTFASYKDKKGNQRTLNTCLQCTRRHAADRQARYKEKHGDKIREAARLQKYLRYHKDPEFRQKCIDDATERQRHERKKNPHPK